MIPIKVCIVGATGHIEYALDGIKADGYASLAGIAKGSAGEDRKVLEAAVEAYGFRCEAFDDYKMMFDRVKPDVVAIACYFSDHTAVIIEAFQRGIHILVEKPVAITLNDLERVRKAGAATDVSLAAMFALRYTPWFAAAYQAVRSGLIGNIRLMNAQKSYKMGRRGLNFQQRALYGGTIPWVGSHAIDWMYWIGGERFVSVYASHSVIANRDHGQMEASALCHFTFTNEVFGSVSIDYLRPAFAQRFDDDRLRLVGTGGIIEIQERKVYLLGAESEEAQELALAPEENMFCDFLNQIRGTGTCKISTEDSFAVTEACLKAVQSADEKRIVLF